jgi:hypothetical protein
MSLFTPMQHIMQQLRMQSILNPLSGPQQPPQEEDDYDVASRIGQLYQPEDKAINAYLSTAQQLPNRADYQPSRLRRIGALIAGIGAGSGTASRDAGGTPIGYRGDPVSAYKTAKGITDEPYGEAVEDWARKLEPLKAAAIQEEQRNRNERIFGEQTIQREINANRERRLGRENQQKIAQNEEKIRISNMRASAYDWKSRHPNHRFEETKEGYLIGIDPATNKAEYVQDSQGNLIKSSKMDEESRIRLGIQGRLDVESLRGANRASDIADRTKGQIDVKKTPAAGVVKPGTEQETTVTDKAGKVVGSKKVVTKPIPGNQPQMPSGFYKGQRIKSRTTGKMGTVQGVTPDGKPDIVWDK